MVEQTIVLHTYKNSLISEIYSKITNLNLRQLKLLKNYIDNIDDHTKINEIFDSNSKHYIRPYPYSIYYQPQSATPKFKSPNTSINNDEEINTTFNNLYNNIFNK